jgi:hypothetical protein
VISKIDPDFRKCFRGLPKEIKIKAKQKYKDWKNNPNDPLLKFKSVHPKFPLWSVSISYHWRALGLRDGNTISWFWIGSHEDYNKIKKSSRANKSRQNT